MKKGKVLLVGAGPGDPELLTWKAVKALETAEVIIHDDLVQRALLSHASPDAELISCGRLGKRRRGYLRRHGAQKRIIQLMLARARKGKTVLRLKNGDPLIFSRIGEEIDALRRARIPFTVIPGITAAQAAASRAVVPLTDRELASSVVFVTGHEQSPKSDGARVNWSAVSQSGTIVLYMALHNVVDVTRRLREGGRSARTPVLIAAHIGQGKEQIFRTQLSKLPEIVRRKRLQAPALFVVGEVVTNRERSRYRLSASSVRRSPRRS